MSKTDEETRWENAAAAYDNGKGLILREFDPDDKNEMSGVYDALCVTEIGAMSRLRRYVRRLREEGNAQTSYAYLVTGEIERSQVDAGTRYELFRLAKGGYYPDGMGPDTAFSVKSHANDDAKRLLSFSVFSLPKAPQIRFL